MTRNIKAKLWVRREDSFFYFYKKEPVLKSVFRWGSRTMVWVPGFAMSFCVADFRKVFPTFPLGSRSSPRPVTVTLKVKV